MIKVSPSCKSSSTTPHRYSTPKLVPESLQCDDPEVRFALMARCAFLRCLCLSVGLKAVAAEENA